ncbi:hypothetical protein [Flavobacterium alkalisoli]|uniref:hypothetical protein n=1 Tax=Flavobacterium alkalisoli TaxID=2602769 RepID=UPI003A916521
MVVMAGLSLLQAQQKKKENEKLMKVEAMKTRMSPYTKGLSMGNVTSEMASDPTLGMTAQGAMSGMAMGQNMEQADLNTQMYKQYLGNKSNSVNPYSREVASSGRSPAVVAEPTANSKNMYQMPSSVKNSMNNTLNGSPSLVNGNDQYNDTEIMQALQRLLQGKVS